jgi:hypothetical protein
MEAGYGGPVWHASVHQHGGGPFDPSAATQRAHRALSGVGDAALGEWLDDGYDGHTVHLRRRVARSEWLDAPWGMDLRGTILGRARLMKAGIGPELGERIGEW